MREHSGNDDVVIPRIMDRLSGAVETSENVGENWHVVIGNLIVDAVVDGVVRAREMFGERLLICSENVYGEALGVEVGVERIGYLGDVPKYERWGE